MATWDDLEKLTWDQLEVFTHDDIERLTIDDIERYVSDIWPVLTSLSSLERAELRSGILSGSLPPPLLASAESGLSKVQGAALKLWSDFQSEVRKDPAGWMSVLLVCIGMLSQSGDDKPQPQPAPIVIVKEVPEQVRPLMPIVPPDTYVAPPEKRDA